MPCASSSPHIISMSDYIPHPSPALPYRDEMQELSKLPRYIHPLSPSALLYQSKEGSAIKSRQLIPMIPIPPKHPLAILAPPSLLLQPPPSQKLPDAGIVRFLLRGLERDEPVEVLVDGGGFAGAAVGGLGGTVSGCGVSGKSHRSVGGGDCIPVDIVLVTNVPEEPDLVLGDEHGDAEGVDRGVSKALVIEATASVEPIEILLVGLAAEEVEVADLEVGEELAVVVITVVARVEQPVKVGFRMDELWVSVDEGACAGPQGRKGTGVIEDVHVEAVFHVVVPHETKNVVVDVAEEVNLSDDVSSPLCG